PGLIEGAAEGAGLGHQFLKHLQRTGLLLHLVEIQPLDGSEPAHQVRVLERELEQFDPSLIEKPRWLVITKTDQMQDEERDQAVAEIIDSLEWQRPWFAISSLSGSGLKALMHEVGRAILDSDDD
ncbi:MAG: GTPase ObgE, partial [Wenzhouxiangellaceae bacterium]